jgi:3-methyladenine DNA glycosylase/8-oxoguanine DNA glycosylase
MPTLSITPPSDYWLPRDVCSYGYFVLEPNRWDVKSQSLTRIFDLGDVSATAVLSQKEPGGPIKVALDRTLKAAEKKTLIAQATRMLRLDEDASIIAEFHRVDPRWKSGGRGRLFRSPTFFEDVVKTVTSCNVTWPGTVAMNRRLCEVLGVDGAFPSVEKMARARAATLRARCRVGYRDQRLVDLAKLFRSGAIDVRWYEDPATPEDQIHAAMLELPGVGPYAAANILQLLGRFGRLPLDTESVRHGKTLLGFTGTSAQIMKRVVEHFAPFGPHAFRSYWFEMWAHYEKVAGPAHTWEPKKTATTFTAATLKKAAADAERALTGQG